MTMIEAWNATPHGGKLSRPGLVVEKWIGEKPGLAPSFQRWMDENVMAFPVADLMSGDWNADT